MFFLTQAADLVAGAMMKWLGEVEGRAAGKLISAIRGAAIQMDVARGLLATAEREGVPPAERVRLIKIAQGLVEGSRTAVRDAAAGVALAVPREVDDAFDNLAQAAGNAAVRLGQEVKETAIAWFLIAAVFVWFWLEKRERRA